MPYPEAIIISRRLYLDHMHERLEDDDYMLDELYVAMFALANNTHRYEAAKLPLRFKDTQELEGTTFAAVSLLNNMGRATVEPTGAFVQGYWIDARDCIVINKIPVLQGYVRDYEPEGVDADLAVSVARVQPISYSLELTA